MTSASLLASRTRLAARTAASVDNSPAAPTIAAITTWTLSPATACGKRLGAAFHARRGTAVAQRRRAPARQPRVHQHHQVRVEPLRLLDDGFPAALGAEHGDPEPFRMQGNHFEGAAPDAPGGTQDGQAAQQRSCDHTGAEQPKRI